MPKIEQGLSRYERVLLWGCTRSKHSHRFIWQAFSQALHRLGYRTLWLADEPGNRDLLRAGDLLFAFDVESEALGPAVPGVDYVLHNCAPGHPVYEALEPERYIGLQVYTADCEAWGEAWGPCRRFDPASQTLFQPWGTNLFVEAFYEPVYTQTSREAVFVGSVWDDGGLGNAEAISELTRALASRGLQLRLLHHIPDQANVDAVRGARLAPAIAGNWQVAHNYVPCRALKNPSYGALGITNVPVVKRLFGDAAVTGETIMELVDTTLSMRRAEYLERVKEQQRVIGKHLTYRESLEAIGRALDVVKGVAWQDAKLEETWRASA